MTVIPKPKPAQPVARTSLGLPYPAFTKLGAVLGKPDGWVDYTSERNAGDGPFCCGVIDTHAVGRTDLTYRYYLVTGDDHPSAPYIGYLFAAGSNNPETGWTYLNSGDPVFDGDDLEAGDGTEVSSPMFIDYNPHIDRFVIYPHTRDYAGPTGTEQATLRLVTNDFVTYEALGVGGSSASAIVVCGQGNHHGYAYGHRFQGNLLLQHRICGGFGYLEGASIALDDLGSVFLPLPDYTRPSAIQTIFDDPEDVQHGSQLIIMLGGRPWAIIMRRPSADEALQQRGDDIWIAPLADDYRTMTGKPVQIIARGGTGAIDEIAAHVPGALVTQNAVYIYYSAEANTTWAQVIAVARCRIYKDGTYDT